MELKDYIAEAAYSVLAGINQVDEKLKKEKLGRVCKGNIITMGSDLVSLGLLKRDDPNDKSKSKPVIVLQYDVNFTVEEVTSNSHEKDGEAGVRFLQIFNVNAQVKKGDKASLVKRSIQNLKFSIPIDLAE